MLLTRGALVVVLAFGVLGLAIPLAALTRHGIGGLWLDPSVLAVVRLTVWQAFVSATLAACTGYPLGVWAHRRPRVRAALAVPFALPTLVVAALWITLFGRAGWFPDAGIDGELIYAFRAVIVVHVVLNAPWIASMVAEAMDFIPRSEWEAARTLGARPMARLREVIWPRTRWALGSATLQAYSLCAMSFVLVLILGGGPPVDTLQTSIYARLSGLPFDFAGAAACGVWQLILTAVPWSIFVTLSPRARAPSVVAPPRASGTWGWIGLGLVVVATVLVVQLAGRSSSHRYISSSVWLASVSQSFWLAASSTLLALVITAAGVVVSRRHPTVGILMALPSGVSVFALGIGIYLAYPASLDPYGGKLVTLIFVQAVVLVPIAYRRLWPVSLAEPRAELEASRTLGASPWRAFCEIDRPRWRRPIVATAALLAALSLGEVAAYLFFASGTPPVSVLMMQWMAQYEFEKAHFAGLFLMAACGSLVVVSERLSR